MRENALNIYTDGSSLSRPRLGGIGVRFVTINDDGDEETEDFSVPGFKGATNNSMELYACVVALKRASKHPALPRVSRVCISSDSRYVVDNHKKAIYQWSRQKWLRSSGAPVLNADLWKDLIREMKKLRRPIELIWVKGHAKNVHNKAVDKLAKDSARKATDARLSVTAVRRKKTAKVVDLGSVEMKGQRLVVRIITSEYLRVQRLTKYKYEVLSPGSRYLGNVDLIFSNLDMRAGHHYEISVNRDTANPRVMRIIQEAERQTFPRSLSENP